MERDSFIFYRSFFEGIALLPSAEDKVKAYEAIMEFALNSQEQQVDGLAGIVLAMAKPQISANMQRARNGSVGGRPKDFLDEDEKGRKRKKTTIPLEKGKVIEIEFNEEPAVQENEKTEKPMVCENEKTEKPMVYENGKTEKPMVCENGKTEKPMVYENGKTEKPMVYENGTKQKPNVNENVNENENANGNVNGGREKEKKEKDPPPTFCPPSVASVRQYCLERKNQVDAQRFVDFYESKGWMVGVNKMQDWKAAIADGRKIKAGTLALPPKATTEEMYFIISAWRRGYFDQRRYHRDFKYFENGISQSFFQAFKARCRKHHQPLGIYVCPGGRADGELCGKATHCHQRISTHHR